MTKPEMKSAKALAELAWNAARDSGKHVEGKLPFECFVEAIQAAQDEAFLVGAVAGLEAAGKCGPTPDHGEYGGELDDCHAADAWEIACDRFRGNIALIDPKNLKGGK